MTHPGRYGGPIAPRRTGVTRPDWVILGCQMPDAVYIYASNKLVLAELELLINEYEFSYELLRPVETKSMVKMSATGKEYVMTAGANYQEALAALFSFWKPERPDEQKAIGR